MPSRTQHSGPRRSSGELAAARLRPPRGARRPERATSESRSEGHEVVALERAALERWGKGDPSGFLEICAPDVVYFDPGLERRIDGLDALTRYYEGLRGTVSFERFELINPLVQVVGDAAVLTFNYASYGKDRAPSRWNCTEVFRRAGGAWQIIQTHWSYTIAKRA